MEEIGEFQDWEMLQNSDAGVIHSPEIGRELGAVEGDYERVIRLDYFSIDSDKRDAKAVTVEEQSSVDSDNPSWVDPCSQSGHEHPPRNEEGFEGITSARRNSVDFLSDSRSDESNFGKGNYELDIGDDLKGVGFEGIGAIQGIETNNKDSSEFLLESGSERSVSQKAEDFRGTQEFDCEDDLNEEVSFQGVHEFDCEDNLNKQVCFQGVGEIQGIEVKNNENPSHSVGDISFAEKFEDNEGEGQSDFDQIGDGLELSSDVEPEVDMVNELESGGAVGAEGGTCEELKSGEEGKRGMVWWKLPFELLKFCVFRVSPVWTISIAAAVMGFVILRRRLYRVKRKSRSIPLKVTVEDKKVYQLMLRATRLNEAFSVVRRVPIIRPSLTAAGVTPWSMLS